MGGWEILSKYDSKKEYVPKIHRNMHIDNKRNKILLKYQLFQRNTN